MNVKVSLLESTPPKTLVSYSLIPVRKTLSQNGLEDCIFGAVGVGGKGVRKTVVAVAELSQLPSARPLRTEPSRKG
jgi:hypothetical protein